MNIKENFKISIQEDFNQGQITIAIKDPSENKEKKYLFCYALNSIKTLFTEVDKFESVFVWLPISHWQGSTFKKYVDLLHAYIIIITIDKSKTEEKKAEIIKKVVNLINFNGESILHGLCKNYGSWESSDRKKLIEHFIKHGANINQSDYAKKIHLYGYTPFEYACKVGGREIIKFLLQHGAKTNLNHECGKKLLERARANRLPDAPGFLDLVEKSCDPVLLKKFDKTQKNSKKLKRNRNSSNQLKINQKNSGETISKVTDQNNNDINNIEGVRTRMVVHEYGTWVMGVLAIIYHFLLKQ
jgi:hypothetical protein